MCYSDYPTIIKTPIRRTATAPELVAALEAAGYTVIPPPKPKVWPFYFTAPEFFAQDTYWVTGKGEKWLISDMSLDHLANVWRFLYDKRHWLAKQAGVDVDDLGGTKLYKAVVAQLRDAMYGMERKYDWYRTKGEPVEVLS